MMLPSAEPSQRLFRTALHARLFLMLASCSTKAASLPGPPPAENRAAALVQGAKVDAPPASASATGRTASPVPTGSIASAAEERACQVFMQDFPKYLSRLTFMVYWKQDKPLDPGIARMAVVQAARWLKERNSQDGT